MLTHAVVVRSRNQNAEANESNIATHIMEKKIRREKTSESKTNHI